MKMIKCKDRTLETTCYWKELTAAHMIQVTIYREDKKEKKHKNQVNKIKQQIHEIRWKAR